MPKANSRRLDKTEKGVLVHLLQAPKLTNGDIAKIIDVDERTISRRRKQLRTLGHLSPERNVKGAEKLRPWHLERIIALLEENNDLQLKDVQEFLKKEFDLHVTVSTISRQLSRANHARARRPGYKNTRPDLQAPPQEQEQQQQPIAPGGPIQDAQAATTSGQQEAPVLPVQSQVQVDEGADTSAAVQQQQQQAGASVSPALSAAPQSQTAALKLACPFYRHEPQKYEGRPFCQSSWHSVRDVKEHVFRQHMQPRFRCNRCMGTFGDDNALVLHQRAQEPCPLREWMVPEGCSEEQKDKIRKGDKGEENQKWKRMYRILFPDAEQDAIPDGLVYESAAYFAEPIDPNLEGWQQAASQDQQDAV